MNNIIKEIECSEYSHEDYINIINICNKKIINIKQNELNQKYITNIKKIYIKNEELSYFFNIIYNTFKISFNDYIKSIIISFDYNNYAIDLCVYNEDDDDVFMNEKIHILDKYTHSYEVYYDNCDKILLNILQLKTVKIIELNEFIKILFEYAFQIIPNNLF
jgi:hypothetical protein